MLPSDHFVRMYNELFKILADKGMDALRAYWLEIADLQKSILGPCVESDGFRGMYGYWDRIRIEENCDMDLHVGDDRFELCMNRCPSLAKNLDNDAGLCIHYCEHCAGWIAPVLRSYGYWVVYDIISPVEPRCRMQVFADRDRALEQSARAIRLWDPYGDLA